RHDVGGAERPARADRRRLLPDREVDEPGHLAVAVQRGDALLEAAYQQHAPVQLEEVGGRERGRRTRTVGHQPCIVMIGTNAGESRGGTRAMSDEIEIPGAFPRGNDVADKRVVITGAGRGLGRLLAHAFSDGGASVALVARTETDLKSVAAQLPGPALVVAGD